MPASTAAALSLLLKLKSWEREFQERRLFLRCLLLIRRCKYPVTLERRPGLRVWLERRLERRPDLRVWFCFCCCCCCSCCCCCCSLWNSTPAMPKSNSEFCWRWLDAPEPIVEAVRSGGSETGSAAGHERGNDRGGGGGGGKDGRKLRHSPLPLRCVFCSHTRRHPDCSVRGGWVNHEGGESRARGAINEGACRGGARVVVPKVGYIRGMAYIHTGYRDPA